MVRAIWNGAVIAESDDTLVVDGYTYFPRASVNESVLVASSHTSTCPWKGRANYYTLAVNGAENRDAAWFYPSPRRAARSIDGHIAFWRGVRIERDPAKALDKPNGFVARLRRRPREVPATTSV